MILEDSDIFKDQVCVAGSSRVFHLLMEKESTGIEDLEPACYDPQQWADSDRPAQLKLSDAIKIGKRPCKQCMIRLSTVTGTTVKECSLCDRINVVHDIEYSTYTIGYAYGGEKEVNICLNCSVKFGIEETFPGIGD